MAEARVGFKRHALIYVLVNLLLAGIWFFTRGMDADGGGFYWPVWSHLGWGLGLAFHAFGVYGPGKSWEAREEEKLRRKYGRA